MKYCCLTLVVMFALALALPGLALADWQEAADRHADENAEVEDNPAWDAYAFNLDYADGSGTLTFNELARGQQPFVLFFWLTDCPVCHLQLPYVKLFHEAVEKHDLDVRVVAINLDDDASDALDMFEEKNLKFELLIDPHARRTDEAFSLRDTGTPVAYVFDADGLMVKAFDGFHGDLGYQVLTMLKMDVPKELDKK